MSLSNLPLLAPHLDKHLVWPLLQFLEQRGADVKEAQCQLVTQTSIFDVAVQMHQGRDEEVKELETRKAAFVSNIEKLLKSCGTILSVFFDENEDGSYSMKLSHRQLEEEKKQGRLETSELYEAHKITDNNIKALYDLGFGLYDAGSYDQASDMLLLYLTIGSKKNASLEPSAQWGKLVCDSLMGYWDVCLSDIEALRTQLELSGTTVSRSWLLHFSLFTYFKRVGASQAFLEHVIDFSTYVYANTIQVASPHLLRYLAAASILNRKKRNFLKRVAKMADQETYNYRDVFTDFLLAATECDLKRSNELLKKFAEECEGDFFLKDCKDDLINAGRMMVYEDYLKVHRVVSIPAVAVQLGMEVDKAEVWLVTLIQEAKIDAEIDSVSQKIQVVSAASNRSVHREVISRLESISRPSN